jgi:phage shock protein PspC (stress-responsive transcriptional regulator)
MDQRLLFFWLVFSLMLIAGIAGSYCSYQWRPDSGMMRVIRVIAIVTGLFSSTLALYIFFQYPQTIVD